jgi:hypothetical protein
MASTSVEVVTCMWQAGRRSLRSCAELIQHYPSIIRRVTLNQYNAVDAEGVNIEVRRGQAEACVQVPTNMIEQLGLPELLGEINREAERQLVRG